METPQDKAERALFSLIENAIDLADGNASARSIAARIYDDHRGLMNRLRRPWIIERITRLVERKLSHKQVAAMGGQASAAALTAEQRKEKARKAIQARWNKATPEERQANAQRANQARWGKNAKPKTPAKIGK